MTKNRKKQQSNSLLYGYYFYHYCYYYYYCMLAVAHARASKHTFVLHVRFAARVKNVTHMLFFGEVFPAFRKSISIKYAHLAGV